MANRKPKRSASATERRAARRAPYDKVLIVCEGTKTEPSYFRDLIKFHDISSVNVRISGECGAAPTSVVEYAIALAQSEANSGEPFDRVYCVFDRDSYHLATQKKVYQAALARIEEQNQEKLVFYAGNSVPSFEYWLLLHFCETHKPFAAQGNKSVGDVVLKELKKYWPNYEKGLLRPYQYLKTSLPNGEAIAIERARKALKHAQLVGDANPSTKVHELVEYLIHIKDPQDTSQAD